MSIFIIHKNSKKMEENYNQLYNQEIDKNQFSEHEQKEKLILDFYYLKSLIESKIENKKVAREIKKCCSEIEENLNQIVSMDVSKKNIKNYIQLKNSKFDDDILKLTKYIKK